MGQLGARSGSMGAPLARQLYACSVGMYHRPSLDATYVYLTHPGGEPYRRMARMAAVGQGWSTLAGRQ